MSDEFDHLAQQLAPLLLDRSPDVYLLVDPTRLAILAARGPTERLLGRPACHMVGLPLQALRPRQPPARLAVLGPAHLVQPGQWAEMAVANAEGTTRVCAAWITRIGATEHDPVLVRLTDVSERFELAQRLREVQQQARKAAAERIQDRLASEEQKRSNLLYIFTAGLSHELNNPLSAALANFSAAQDICREASERPSPQNSAEMHELMRDAQSALRRMETVVKKLRQLEYLPRVQPLEVATWIRQRPDLRDIEVVAPQTLSALSDPILLERILDPLLDNARRAMNDRPGIRLSTGKNGDEFFLQVEDQGPGIPPDLAQRIFDPFFTTRPPGQGLGLGLFFARNAAEQLGGKLTFSPRDGGGCIFCARLPLDASSFDRKTSSVSPYEALRTGTPRH